MRVFCNRRAVGANGGAGRAWCSRRFVCCRRSTRRRNNEQWRPLAPPFSELLGFLTTPLRACRTRCRSDARRAAAGAAVLVLLLVKRTITDRAAAIFAPICQVRRPNCLLLDTLGLIPSYNIGRAEVHSPTSLTPGCLTTPQTPEPPPTGPMSSLAVAPRRHTRTTGPGHESAPRGDAIAANQKRYVSLRGGSARHQKSSPRPTRPRTTRRPIR